MIAAEIVYCLGIDPLELALIGPMLRGDKEAVQMLQQLEGTGFTVDTFKSGGCRSIWNEAKRQDEDGGYCEDSMIAFCNKCEALGVDIVERSMWMSEASTFGLIVLMPHHAGTLTDQNLVRAAKEALSHVSGDTANDMIAQIEMGTASIRAKTLKTENELHVGGKELIEELDRAMSGEKLPQSFVDSWDRMMGGLCHSQLIVPAGRPGGGKTALVEQIIHEQLKRGNPVVYIQREMSRSRAIGRLAARGCGVAWSDIELRKATYEQYQRFKEYVQLYMKFPLHLEPASACNGQNIGGMVRHHVRQTGAELVVMDYLQLVDCPKGVEKRIAIGDVCRALKLAANDTGATILAIAQLNREQDRNKSRPTLADLNESGDIERTADAVVALWEKEPREERTRYPIEWSILKNRNGGHGSLPILFDGPSMSFLGIQPEVRI